MRTADGYEILYDLEQGKYDEKAVGAVCTKTVRAGDSLEVECFPVVRITQKAEHEKKRRAGTAAQQKLNDRNSVKRFRRLMEANFGKGDFFLTPTFDYGMVDDRSTGKRFGVDFYELYQKIGLPTDDAEARRFVTNFLRRVKALYVKKGGRAEDFKYMYVIERTHEPRDTDPTPEPPHFHFHVVVKADGLMTRDEVESRWEYGYSNARALDLKHNGLEQLARYMLKNIREKGKRRWSGSKNLKQPEITRSFRKVSKRRARKVADDVRSYGKELFEQIYPEYQLMDVEVRLSDFIAGAYIYARMRRRL